MAGDTVRQIKEKLSIEEVVRPYVALKRSGKSFSGPCPFHKEKTPSFYVSPERGTFHCFGCGMGGDLFSFIEKIEGLDFKGALTLLADKAGVRIEYTAPDARDAGRIERLREAMARAAGFYTAGLAKESDAYRYALSRGLTDETISSWGLGYAPDAWRTLLEALQLAGFRREELAAAGLIKEADGKPGTWYDRFRHRLMFPIRDTSGRVVAFTGRALSSDEQAKYLNSPETDLYRKSDILFGMDRAKDAIRTRGFTLLVEGQMDVLHAHQAGFVNTLALSGTALSEKHLALMKRYSENLMLCLDADKAGLSATAKSAEAALRHGLKVKAVRLPSGKDPADIIAEDPSAFAQYLKEARHIVEFFIAVLAERERDPHRLIAAAEKVAIPLMVAIQSPMEREHLASVAGRALGLSGEAVKEAMRRYAKDRAAKSSEYAKDGSHAKNYEERRGARVVEPFRRRDLLLAAIHAYADTPLARRVEAEYTRITEAPPPPEPPPEKALFEAERMFGDGRFEGAADELLYAFEEAVVREAYRQAVGELRMAEQTKETERVQNAQSACARLSVRLSQLHAHR